MRAISASTTSVGISIVMVFCVSLTSVSSVFIGRSSGREDEYYVVSAFRRTRSQNSTSARTARRGTGPVGVEHRPEHLVVILPMPQEGLSQHALRRSAELAERTVPAAVLGARTRLESLHAKRAEGEIQDEPCGAG